MAEQPKQKYTKACSPAVLVSTLDYAGPRPRPQTCSAADLAARCAGELSEESDTWMPCAPWLSCLAQRTCCPKETHAESAEPRPPVGYCRPSEQGIGSPDASGRVARTGLRVTQG